MPEFNNPADAEIGRYLANARRVAVVGMSPDRERPSYGVAAALDRLGFEITAVRPDCEDVRGFPAVPELQALPEPADLAVVFRRPETLGAVVDDAIAGRIPGLWFQLGVVDTAAALRARAAGLFVVMDRCIYRDGIPLLQAE